MGFGTERFGCVSKLHFIWLTEVRGRLTASWPKEVLLANESPGILGWECWWALEVLSTFKNKQLSGLWTALHARLQSIATSPQCPRLFYAVKKSRMDTVQLLLTKGANDLRLPSTEVVRYPQIPRLLGSDDIVFAGVSLCFVCYSFVLLCFVLFNLFWWFLFFLVSICFVSFKECSVLFSLLLCLSVWFV